MGCIESASEDRVGSAKAVEGGPEEKGGGRDEVGRTARALKSLRVLSSVSDKELREAAALMRVDLHPPNTVLGREGIPAKRILFMIEGKIVVTASNDFGLPQELSVLSNGVVLHELLLFDHKNPQATTTATLEETLVFSLTPKEALSLEKSAPKFFKALNDLGQQRLAAKEAIQKIPMLRQVTRLRQFTLVAILKPRTYRRNEVVLEQGEVSPREFYIVAEGSVDVFLGRQKVRTVTKGGFFGEVSLVTDNPHSATVVVGEGCKEVVLLTCSRDDFKNVLAQEPAVLAEISIRVLGKRCLLNDVLNLEIGRNALAEFSAKEFAEENLDFWIACTRLERMDITIKKRTAVAIGADPAELKRFKAALLKTQADTIFYKFVAESSTAQINLSSRNFENLRERIKNADYSYDMFAEAKTEIYNLVSGDTFARFQESAEMTEFLKKIGSYQEID